MGDENAQARSPVRYTSLRDISEVSPGRGALPTTDLYNSYPRAYRWLIKGEERILLVLGLVIVIAFLLFFFLPRSVILSPSQLTMDTLNFNTREKTVSTNVVAKITVSNPNFVALKVHSIRMAIDYICKSCVDAEAITLGEQIIIVATSFPARTESATMPLAFQFSALLPEVKFWTFREAFQSNCTRDKIYFVSPRCVADVIYLGGKKSIELETLRTRVLCQSSSH